jgi:hypothetical protein
LRAERAYGGAAPDDLEQNGHGLVDAEPQGERQVLTEGDCPRNGVSGSTRQPAGWRGGVTDDRNTGGREPIEV